MTFFGEKLFKHFLGVKEQVARINWFHDGTGKTDRGGCDLTYSTMQIATKKCIMQPDDFIEHRALNTLGKSQCDENNKSAGQVLG